MTEKHTHAFKPSRIYDCTQNDYIIVIFACEDADCEETTWDYAERVQEVNP